MLAAAYETSETDEEFHRRAQEVCEGIGRPEVAELVEAAVRRSPWRPRSWRRWASCPPEGDEHWPENRPDRWPRRPPAGASPRTRGEQAWVRAREPNLRNRANAAFHTPLPLPLRVYGPGRWRAGVRGHGEPFRHEAKEVACRFRGVRACRNGRRSFRRSAATPEAMYRSCAVGSASAELRGTNG